MGYFKNMAIRGGGRRRGRGRGTLQVTEWFFDSPKVMAAVDAGTRKVLSRFGAFVRRTARQGIRRRRRSSLPGTAPTNQTGLLKSFIFFSYDPAARSVVIGPERLGSKDGTVPRLLEHGGRTTIRRGGKRIRVRIAPRPYMGPAMQKELPALPAMWRSSVR